MFGFVPSEPFSYQATCLLLYVVQSISAVLSTETTFYERQQLVRLAYSLLFRKSELLLLPASVSGYLISKSLKYAVHTNEAFCEDYAAIIEYLIRQKEQSFNLCMSLCAFGPNILGEDANASLLCRIRSQTHGISRRDFHWDFFVVDLSCSRTLELIARRNKKLMEESSAEKRKVYLPRLKEIRTSTKEQCLVSTVAPIRFKFVPKDSDKSSGKMKATDLIEPIPSGSTWCGRFRTIGRVLSTTNFERSKK